MGKHCGSNSFGGGHLQPTLDLDRNFRAVASKRPYAAFALQINDSLMLAEIGWRCGGAGALEVAGRTQYQSLASTDAANCQRRVQQLSHPQPQIDALLHEVDLAVVEHDFQIEVRVLCEELRQQRNEVNASECDGGANAQSSLQPGAGTTRGEFRLVGLLDRALGAFEITESCLGRRQSACRAREQLDAQKAFELRDRLRDRRLADAKLPCGAGEGSGLDHPDESLHRSQAIHRCSPLFFPGMSDIASSCLPRTEKIDHVS